MLPAQNNRKKLTLVRAKQFIFALIVLGTITILTSSIIWVIQPRKSPSNVRRLSESPSQWVPDNLLTSLPRFPQEEYQNTVLQLSETDHTCINSNFNRTLLNVSDIFQFVKEPNEIHFTFDDGPNAERTPLLLDILSQHNIYATFFLVGVNMWDPHLLQSIISRGHIIGCHSMRHEDVLDMNVTEFHQMMDEYSALLYNATGQRAYLYRPPGGYIIHDHITDAFQHGFITQLWDIDSLDSKLEHNPDQIIENVLDGLPTGGNLLMHEYEWTLDIQQDLIESIHDEGGEIVPISGILNANQKAYLCDSYQCQNQQENSLFYNVCTKNLKCGAETMNPPTISTTEDSSSSSSKQSRKKRRKSRSDSSDSSQDSSHSGSRKRKGKRKRKGSGSGSDSAEVQMKNVMPAMDKEAQATNGVDETVIYITCAIAVMVGIIIIGAIFCIWKKCKPKHTKRGHLSVNSEDFSDIEDSAVVEGDVTLES